jgi:hypothetical protein
MDRDKRLVPAKPNPIRIAPPLPEQLGCTTPEKLYPGSIRRRTTADKIANSYAIKFPLFSRLPTNVNGTDRGFMLHRKSVPRADGNPPLGRAKMI